MINPDCGFFVLVFSVFRVMSREKVITKIFVEIYNTDIWTGDCLLSIRQKEVEIDKRKRLT